MTAPRSRSALQLGERSGRAAVRGRCAARRTARAWSCRWRARTRGSWRPRARRSPAACRAARAWSPCSATLLRWTCSPRQTKARPASARAAPRSGALLAALAGGPRVARMRAGRRRTSDSPLMRGATGGGPVLGWGLAATDVLPDLRHPGGGQLAPPQQHAWQPSLAQRTAACYASALEQHRESGAHAPQPRRLPERTISSCLVLHFQQCHNREAALMPCVSPCLQGLQQVLGCPTLALKQTCTRHRLASPVRAAHACATENTIKVSLKRPAPVISGANNCQSIPNTDAARIPRLQGAELYPCPLHLACCGSGRRSRPWAGAQGRPQCLCHRRKHALIRGARGAGAPQNRQSVWAQGCTKRLILPGAAGVPWLNPPGAPGAHAARVTQAAPSSPKACLGCKAAQPAMLARGWGGSTQGRRRAAWNNLQAHKQNAGS